MCPLDPDPLAPLLPPARDRSHGHLHGPVASASRPTVIRSISSVLYLKYKPTLSFPFVATHVVVPPSFLRDTVVLG